MDAQHYETNTTPQDTEALIKQTFSILLVEDDNVTLKQVATLLNKYGGYTVTSVQTAPEALQLLKDAKQSGQDFDLVLTDLILPEVSGFDLIQDVVTGRNGISNVPVVVMSSEDSRESVMQAFECGAADYLIKPIRRNEVSTLWQHIWRNNRLKQPAGKPQQRAVDSRSRDINNSTPAALVGGIGNGGSSRASTYGSADGQFGGGGSGMSSDQLRGFTSSSPDPECSPLMDTMEDQQPQAAVGGCLELSKASGGPLPGPTNVAVAAAVHLDISRAANLLKQGTLLNVAERTVPQAGTALSQGGPDMSYGSSEPETITRQEGRQRPSGLDVGATAHHDDPPSAAKDLGWSSPSQQRDSKAHDQERGDGPQDDDDEEAEAAAAVLGSLRHQTGGSSAFTSLTVFLPRTGEDGTKLHHGKTANLDPAPNDQQARTQKASSSSIDASPVAVPGLLLPSIPPLIPSFFPTGHHADLQYPMSASQIASALPNQQCLQQPAPSQVLLPDSVMRLIGALSAAKDPKPGSSTLAGALDTFPGHPLAAMIPLSGSGLTMEGDVGKAMRRQAAVSKYLLKRKNRCFQKKVRYESRKKLADSRPRVRGQFVKYSADGEALHPPGGNNDTGSLVVATASGSGSRANAEEEQSGKGGSGIETEEGIGMSEDEP